MTLTQALIFAVTTPILFGGLFDTLRVFRRGTSEAAPLRARARNARHEVGRS